MGSRHRRGHHYRQTQRNTQYFVDERLTEIFNQRGISIRNNANIKEVDFRNVDWMKELHIGSLPFIKVSAKKISEEKLVIVGSLILGTNFILFVSNNIVSVGGAVIPFVVGNGLMWPSFMSILSRRWIKASRSSTGRCG